MGRGKLALLLLSVGSSLIPAFAELRFEQPEQTFNVKSNQKSVVAHYKFTNTGSAAAKIDGVKTSCGCTAAALTKTDYAPGESGEIAATFNFGGRIGAQEKAILVTVADATDKPI